MFLSAEYPKTWPERRGSPHQRSRRSIQPDGCADASPMFATNTGDYWCNSLKMDAVGGTNCSMPFGTAYGSVNNTLAMVALYSHSAVYGDDFCGGSDQFHYYTLLANYTAFASGVLERPISVFSGKANPLVTRSPVYSVYVPRYHSVEGVNVIGGNQFVRQGSTSTSTSTSPSTFTDSTPTIQASQENQKVNGKLTKSEIIGLAVGVPVASVVLVVAFIFLYRWWKKRHTFEAQWEPDDTSMLQRRSVPMNQVGYTGRAEDSSPTYNALQFRS
ncbi:hypothetical protein DL89DRAFT_255431 [Linderina pennispora]|uniref:Uncharacterized protein n=1 Tax=Linderina pennispora TaxID=61395 RepID=A0A1Y1WIC8_9FUNG|nr:uncharacterized protein DL89DRAFT_255431 [Linderina pennispora]ORX73331.1 hypothetical protein DL89DRAFT_255431 [Linderina pennispora]